MFPSVWLQTKKVLFYILVASLFVQCSSESGGGELALKGPALDDPNFDPNLIGNCSFSPDEGQNVTSQSVDQRLVASGYFDKSLRLSQLDGYLQGSSLSIATSLIRQGVRVYRVEVNKSSSCRYFAFLQQPNDQASDQWQKTSGNDPQSTLLGLFTTTFTRNNASGAVRLVDPTIMVRQDTQKWTLLHEMSHYLFADARSKENGMRFNEELTEKMEELRRQKNSAVRAYSGNPSQSLAMEIVHLYEEFFQTDYSLDQRGPLEEFTIESMLVERHGLDLISQINPSSDVRNAYRYMESNSRDVVRDYRGFLGKLQNLRENTLSGEADSVHQRISQMENQVENILDFIANRLEAARAQMEFIDSDQSITQARFGLSDREPHGHTAHGDHVHHHHYDQQLFDRKAKIMESF